MPKTAIVFAMSEEFALYLQERLSEYDIKEAGETDFASNKAILDFFYSLDQVSPELFVANACLDPDGYEFAGENGCAALAAHIELMVAHAHEIGASICVVFYVPRQEWAKEWEERATWLGFAARAKGVKLVTITRQSQWDNAQLATNTMLTLNAVELLVPLDNL